MRAVRGLFIALAICVFSAAPLAAEPQNEAYSSELQDSVAKLKRELAERQGIRGNPISNSVVKRQEQLNSESSISFLRMFQALVLCLGVFFVYVALTKKLNGGKKLLNDSTMKVLQRMPLSSKSSLLLIEVEGRRVLAAVGSERVHLAALDEIALPMNNAEELCEEPIRLSA